MDNLNKEKNKLSTSIGSDLQRVYEDVEMISCVGGNCWQAVAIAKSQQGFCSNVQYTVS